MICCSIVNSTSVLEGHPTPRFTWSEAATGSLGQGLSIGAGMAMSAHMDKRNFKTYVLMGDSEVAEGSVWEAAKIASYYKLNNLVGIVDCNRLGQSSETMHGYHAQRYAQKFESFGWKVIVIDGHDMQQIVSALEKTRINQERPFMIIAKTIKGYGIDSIENKEGFHGKAFTRQELEQLMPIFEKRFVHAASYNSSSYHWDLPIPQKLKTIIHECPRPIILKESGYKKGELVATRKAFGQALAQLGAACQEVVSLDAEVKNSTFAQLFEDVFPDRFFQCFVAEQNMMGMAIGLAACNKIHLLPPLLAL